MNHLQWNDSDYGYKVISHHYPNLVSSLYDGEALRADSFQRSDHARLSYVSSRDRKTALILCLLGGFWGLHRFYVGRPISGLAMLASMGGLGLWLLVDLLAILGRQFSDCDKRVLL